MNHRARFGWWWAWYLAMLEGCALPRSPILVDAASDAMNAADAGGADADTDAGDAHDRDPPSDGDAGDAREDGTAHGGDAWDGEEGTAELYPRDASCDDGAKDATPDVSTEGGASADDGADGEAGDEAAEASVETGPCVAAIAAGMWHMCVLSRRGNVHCWGYDAHGKLGDGTTMSTARPTLNRTPAMTGANAVAGGGYFTCALTTGNGVRCWGDDHVGQLGLTLDGSMVLPVAPTMDILGSVREIATGYDVACALTETTADGAGVRCWGNNASGQLGIGALSPAVQAFAPGGDVLTGVKSLATGLGRHVCALMTSGGVRCWGQNTHGQLGIGTGSTDPVLSPPNGDVLNHVTAVAVGFYHTCAAMDDGGMRCWGSNDHGQLGDGTTGERWAPPTTTNVLAGTMIKAIAAGYNHTCALTAAGAVYCWGDDQDGQTGDGQLTAELRLAPTSPVPIAATVTSLVTQESANCALTVDGDVQCWGANYYGQLGDGTVATYGRASPASVTGLSALCP